MAGGERPAHQSISVCLSVFGPDMSVHLTLASCTSQVATLLGLAGGLTSTSSCIFFDQLFFLSCVYLIFFNNNMVK